MNKPKLKRDWRGRVVRLLREVKTNGGEVFPAGTVMVVLRNYSGLTLERVVLCTRCRVRFHGRVTGLGEGAVELLPDTDVQLMPWLLPGEPAIQDPPDRKCPMCGAPKVGGGTGQDRQVRYACDTWVEPNSTSSMHRGSACRIIAGLRARVRELEGP
jgi:hypothetical protein